MPEPVLVSIAAALAGKSIASLYDFVKRKLAGRTQALGRVSKVGWVNDVDHLLCVAACRSWVDDEVSAMWIIDQDDHHSGDLVDDLTREWPGGPDR